MRRYARNSSFWARVRMIERNCVFMSQSRTDRYKIIVNPAAGCGNEELAVKRAPRQLDLMGPGNE